MGLNRSIIHYKQRYQSKMGLRCKVEKEIIESLTSSIEYFIPVYLISLGAWNYYFFLLFEGVLIIIRTSFSLDVKLF